MNLTIEKASQNTDTQTYIVKETKDNKTNFLSLNFNDALLRYIFPDCVKTAVTAFWKWSFIKKITVLSKYFVTYQNYSIGLCILKWILNTQHICQIVFWKVHTLQHNVLVMTEKTGKIFLDKNSSVELY